ncbi:hypothetical protein [Natronomonas sp. EA1]|uniref:hypothetical protein n=1 Tax=Natronomonas sp. EA1 TaxID=3421655 RepID=UPI003EBC1983
MTRPWVTAEDTARLTVELENEADDPREIGPVVGDPVFPVNRDGILLWDETGTTEPQPPDCIGTDGKADRPVGYSGGMRPPVELDAGETVTRTVIIADDANTTGCIPGGRYRFELSGVIRPLSDESPESEYEWGFTLDVHASD